MDLKLSEPGQVIHLLALIIGLFTGCYWTAEAMLRTIGPVVPIPALALKLLPGAGTLLLVTLARRHPASYGLALVLLGLIPLFWGVDRLGLTALLLFCLPVILSGVLFMSGGKRSETKV